MKHNMITKEEIESLGWEYDYDEDFKSEIFFFQSSESMFSTYGLKRNHLRGMIRIFNLGRGKNTFSGKLISDNPKEELRTIMLQIGIIK